jgi:hypothetical protein
VRRSHSCPADRGAAVVRPLPHDCAHSHLGDVLIMLCCPLISIGSAGSSCAVSPTAR